MCTNHRGLALLSLPSSVPATLERRVCPLVKPPIQDDFQSWKLDQLFILSRIFESHGRLLNHSTRVLCTWRTHSIAFLEVSLGGCFRGMRCLVCKSWTFPVVVWLHQRCSVSHIHILWTEYLGLTRWWICVSYLLFADDVVLLALLDVISGSLCSWVWSGGS